MNLCLLFPFHSKFIDRVCPIAVESPIQFICTRKKKIEYNHQNTRLLFFRYLNACFAVFSIERSNYFSWFHNFTISVFHAFGSLGIVVIGWLQPTLMDSLSSIIVAKYFMIFRFRFLLMFIHSRFTCTRCGLCEIFLFFLLMQPKWRYDCYFFVFIENNLIRNHHQNLVFM